MSTLDVRRFSEHMKAEADEKSEGGSTTTQLPAKSDLSEAEYATLVASMKSNAETFGRRRN